MIQWKAFYISDIGLPKDKPFLVWDTKNNYFRQVRILDRVGLVDATMGDHWELDDHPFSHWSEINAPVQNS